MGMRFMRGEIMWRSYDLINEPTADVAELYEREYEADGFAVSHAAARIFPPVSPVPRPVRAHCEWMVQIPPGFVSC